MSPQEKARALRPYIVKASVSLPDEDALEEIYLAQKAAYGAYASGHGVCGRPAGAVWRVVGDADPYTL